MARKEKFSVTQVEEALRKTGGIYAHAAAALEEATGTSCSRNAVKGYVERHERLKEICDEARDRIVDIAEGTLFRLAHGGNLGASIFILKCLGKQRGWVERMEQTGKDGGPIEHATKPDLSKLSTEELQQLETILAKADPGTPAGARGRQNGAGEKVAA